MSPLELRFADTVRSIPDSYLIVALDETGHEHPSSNTHPVFGIGGCAFPVRDYDRLIRQPWTEMKERQFPDTVGALHAADLRVVTTEQLDVLNAFFRSQRFGRLAVLVSAQTELPDWTPPYQLVAVAILERIVRLATRFGCDGVVLIFEESQRTDHLAATFFEGYHIELQDGSGTRRIPFLKYRMPKKAAEPFLEVADFVIHTAGGQVRSALKGYEWGKRRDFQAIFEVADRSLVEFIEIFTAKDNAPAT